jgi:hypothetical protein
VVVGTTVTRDLTVSNNSATTAFFFTQNTGVVTGTGFSRVTGGVAGNCPTTGVARTLAAGSSCTIRVQWAAPATPGTATGSVVITGNATVVNAPVTINANAVAPTFRATVSPNPLAFGNWATGTTSAPLNLTVTNTGNSNLAALTFGFGASTANFARVTGGTFPAFAPNCGTTLAAGASCTVKVSFSPTAATSYSRNLTVTATGATITTSPVVLTGTGVAARAVVSVADLTITLLAGTTTDTSAVILTNAAPLGTGANLTVNSVAITSGGIGGGLVFFNLVVGQNACTGQTLPPGGTCTVGVRFTDLGVPTGGSATISFTSNGTPSPATGTITGVVTPAVAAVVAP